MQTAPNILNAINAHDSKLTAQTQGDLIIINVPRADSSVKETTLKDMNKKAEQYRNNIRHIRQNALKSLQKEHAWKDKIESNQASKTVGRPMDCFFR